MPKLVEAFRRADRARLVDARSVRVAQETPRHVAARSSAKDKRVLASARASGALVLCSTDAALIGDLLDARLLPDVGRRKRSGNPIDRRQ